MSDMVLVRIVLARLVVGLMVLAVIGGIMVREAQVASDRGPARVTYVHVPPTPTPVP